MKDTICHRCGKIIAKYGEPIPKDVFQIRLRYVKDRYSWDSKWSYLCPECFHDLEKWYVDKNQELLKNLNAEVQEKMDTREMIIQKLDALIAGAQWSDIVDLTAKEAITIRDLLKDQTPPNDIVRCKECIHRPKKSEKYKNGFDLEFPDNKCPFYSRYPNDDWFCAEGERSDVHLAQ